MLHEFGYPKVLPLPRRAVDAPILVESAATGLRPVNHAVSPHRSRIDGTSGASVRALRHPNQTPAP